ncbi:hypothetical protein RISK_003860 [Rhodopirellula islandica]|uniref:Uncharacterized protein n=1 Tax=Rhodopirellula islandica TaxID=595434 RepID=A0A0J1EFI5_RHOIS|nr:hypothetical protein RISK_003860 [Rhodopirellula islandica]
MGVFRGSGISFRGLRHALEILLMVGDAKMLSTPTGGVPLDWAVDVGVLSTPA